MSAIRINAFVVAATAAAALSAAVVAANATGSTITDPRSDTGTFRCEIQAKPGTGQLALSAVVHAEAPVNGSYSFKVAGRSGGGSSNINQGGAFTATAKGSVVLSTVSLAPGSSFTATLTVTANGATATCTDPKAAI